MDVCNLLLSIGRLISLDPYTGVNRSAGGRQVVMQKAGVMYPKWLMSVPIFV